MLDRLDDGCEPPSTDEVDDLIQSVEGAMDAALYLRQLLEPRLARCWERALDTCRRTRRAWEKARAEGMATEYREADHLQARLALDGVVQATLLRGGPQ
jgi:hypothetical protein